MAEKLFHDVDCYIVQRLYGACCQRMYIGVADGKLYGEGLYRDSAASLDKSRQVWKDLARSQGDTLASDQRLDQWLIAMPKGKRVEANRDYYKRMLDNLAPQRESWLGDYKQIAPGRWAPMTSGYLSTDDDGTGPVVTSVLQQQSDPPRD